MEHQLNNPLRPIQKSRTESPAPEPHPVPQKPLEAKPTETKPRTPTQAPVATPRAELPTPGTSAPLKPEVRKALDEINAPEDLRRLLAELSRNGIELAGPKKQYVKHSYEIDQDLHRRFHDMYPVLGFKKVKDAINDAIATWCDQNQTEFLRRNGVKK